MIVGIPKGLLYYKYHPFFTTFFSELGADIILSSDTNKDILNEGVKHCVDDACLPVKVFHGHVSFLSDKSDLIVIPRIMQIRKREYICPKFCGLPEMVINNVPNLPRTITEPIYATSLKKLYNWAEVAAREITNDRSKVKRAFNSAIAKQKNYKMGIDDNNYRLKIALGGHPYNIYDSFTNMNIVKKLNKLGVGVITEETIDDDLINKEVDKLYKTPFWTFARNSYGFMVYGSKNKVFDGIIYVSSFACGIDSVVVELVKEAIGNCPFMVLKIDEHTGEAGIDTRIEAFIDMLERKEIYENHSSTFGEHLSSSKSII